MRTLSMYLPNNPVRQQTIEALREGLSGIWQQVPEFALTVSEAGLEWRQKMTEKIAREGAPPLGIHIVMGAQWPKMFANVGRNLEEGRIRLIQMVAGKA